MKRLLAITTVVLLFLPCSSWVYAKEQILLYPYGKVGRGRYLLFSRYLPGRQTPSGHSYRKRDHHTYG